jgi:Domain of Unknown Function (DUF1080)
MSVKAFICTLASIIAAAGLWAQNAADPPRAADTRDRWLQHDPRRPRPPVVELLAGAAPVPAPRDAVILFDGRDLDSWRSTEGGTARWKVADGYFEVVPGTGPIETKAKFGDVQLHVEWAAPSPPAGKSQDRGNSGVFLMGKFELQVLDSYQADTYADGQAGAIYGQYPPLANASRPPGEWQTFDAAFRRPRFDKSGKLIEPARITLVYNGILVQNNEEPWGGTNWLEPALYEDWGDRGPIELQDHGHPVRFRNFWVRELPERPLPPAEYPDRPQTISLSAAELDSLTGRYAWGHRTDAKPIVVTRDEGHLLFKFASRPRPIVVLPISASEFILPHASARLTFQRDELRKVTGILFKVGDGEQVLKKIMP